MKITTISYEKVRIGTIGHDATTIDYALTMTNIIVVKISTFEIFTTIIFVVVRARLTMNDYE